MGVVRRRAATLAAQLVAVAVLASVVTFLAVRVLPGDPARQLLGRNAAQSAVDAKRHELGLDRSLPEQFLSWLGDAVRGDFGTSLNTHRDVLGTLKSTVPVTLTLATLGILLATAIGLGLALAAVRRPGGAVDRGITAVAVLTSGLPSFVWGLGLVLVVSLSLKLLPSIGYVNPLHDPVQGIRTLILPVVALSLPSAGVIARIGRVSLLESLGRPNVEFARGKGLRYRRILLAHGLKGAAVPILAIIGTEFAYTIGDTVAVETVFGIPGVGKALLDSFTQRDYPVIQGAVLVLTLVIVVVTFVLDLVFARLDPRLRGGVA